MRFELIGHKKNQTESPMYATVELFAISRRRGQLIECPAYSTLFCD